MAIIVEDGTVVPGANSYVTRTETNDYFKEINDSVWAGVVNNDKDASLVNAWRYLQQKYRLRWLGSRVDATQSGDWPRRGVPVVDFFDPFFNQVGVPLAFQDTYFIPENEIPQEVKDAQMLLARAQIDANSGLTVTLQKPLGRQTSKEKVGSLEVQYMTPEEGGDARQTIEYWDAMQRIEPYLNPAFGAVGRLSRN